MQYLPNDAPLTLFCYAFSLLLFYSFAGWCGEMVYCSLGQRKLCEKRGFLNGLLCPIYGHGALVVLWALHGGASNPVLTFILGGILTSIVEYITSFAMEKLFHMRWWDYSKKPFNIHGRVCLLNSTLFGLASVLLCHVIHPSVAQFLGKYFHHGWAIPVTLTCFGLYLADIVLSVRSAIQIGSRVEKLHAVHADLQAKLQELRAESQWAFEELRAQGIDALEDLWAEGAEARELRLDAAQKALEELKSRISEAYLSLEDRRTEAQNARAAKLQELSDAYDRLTKRLAAAREDSQKRTQALYDGQDIFERRLMHSYPTLRSTRHAETVAKLREYRAERKRLRRERSHTK